MHTFVILCTDHTEVEVQASDAQAARWVASRSAQTVGKSVLTVRPKGCTGLSATSHLGRFCPVHHAA